MIRELFTSRNMFNTFLIITFILGISTEVFISYTFYTKVVGKPFLLLFEREAKADSGEVTNTKSLITCTDDCPTTMNRKKRTN